MNIRFLLSLVVFALVGCASSSVVPPSTPTMEVRHIVVTSNADSVETDNPIVKFEEPSPNLVGTNNFWITAREITLEDYFECRNAGACPQVITGEKYCEWKGMRLPTDEEFLAASQRGMLVSILGEKSAGFRCAMNAMD